MVHVEHVIPLDGESLLCRGTRVSDVILIHTMEQMTHQLASKYQQLAYQDTYISLKHITSRKETQEMGSFVKDLGLHPRYPIQRIHLCVPILKVI